VPISGKPEIGVSFRSRKRARYTRPGHEDFVSRTSECTDLGFTRDRHFICASRV